MKQVCCKDHLGNIYHTQKEMCATYGINHATLTKRLKMGWTLEMALTKPTNTPACDHMGILYKDFLTMCKNYGISPTTYLNRTIKLGWDIEKALLTPIGAIRPDRKPCVDHLGNPFHSIIDMCKTYGISYNRYNRRISIGWTKEEALTIPRNMYIGEYRVSECLKRLNIQFYHDCPIKTIFTALNIPVDWNDFLHVLQHNLELAGYHWSKKKIQKLRPDFVLYTDDNSKIRGAIEFDGEQHQNFMEFFFKSIKEFYMRNNADFVKQSLWEYLNIPMLRIRYDQIDMIDTMVTDFINNPQNYIHNHNTYLSEDEYWAPLQKEKTKIELASAS